MTPINSNGTATKKRKNQLEDEAMKDSNKKISKGFVDAREDTEELRGDTEDRLDSIIASNPIDMNTLVGDIDSVDCLVDMISFLSCLDSKTKLEKAAFNKKTGNEDNDDLATWNDEDLATWKDDEVIGAAVLLESLRTSFMHIVSPEIEIVGVVSSKEECLANEDEDSVARFSRDLMELDIFLDQVPVSPLNSPKISPAGSFE